MVLTATVVDSLWYILLTFVIAVPKFTKFIKIIEEKQLFKEWFQAFSQAAGVTLHIENIYGDNSHHIIESCFKGLARTLRAALEIDPRTKNSIPSTKGSL